MRGPFPQSLRHKLNGAVGLCLTCVQFVEEVGFKKNFRVKLIYSVVLVSVGYCEMYG